MLDICEVTHTYVPGHQDSDEDPVQPTRTAFEGDYLTFERIKSSQTSIRNGRTPSKQLKGLLARTAEFHNQGELMKAMWYHLYDKSTASDIGTLYNVKSQLGDSHVEDEPFKDYYASADLRDRYTIAYLVTGGLAFFGMGTWDSDIENNQPEGEVISDYLMECAQQFVEEFVRIKMIDPDAHAPRSLQLNCSYCHKEFKSRVSALVAHEMKVHGHSAAPLEVEEDQDHTYNYTCVSITLCLLRWEHNHAIRHGDGDRIILVDKFLTLIDKVSHCPKYAFAMLETLSQVNILLSPRDAYLHTWNRVVNHKGKMDTNFPNDQNLEHQNRVFKNEARTYRGTLTDQTLKRVSQSAQATDAICKNFDYGTRICRQSGTHPAPDWTDDIAKLVKSLSAMDLFTNKPGQRRPRKGAIQTAHADILHSVQDNVLKTWIKSCFKKFGRKHFYKY
jgi:hypothetical protein